MSSHSSQLDLISDHSKEKLIEVPKDVLEMTNLKMLFLEGNFLYKLPEGIFWKLPKLMWLDLRNNQLEGLPRSVAYHQCLENLLLTNNNITRLPNELGLVPNLKALQVSENPLIYPPRKIVSEGTKAMRNFLKSQYELSNPVADVIDSNKNLTLAKSVKKGKGIISRESISSEEKMDSNKSESNSEEKKEIYHKKVIKELKEKIGDPFDLQPTLQVKKLTNSSSHSRKRQPEPVKIVHKITRSGDKITMQSCLNKIGLRGDVNRATSNESVREGWLNQLRILLSDQERIIQQERNLRALSNWRSKAREEPPRIEAQAPKVFRDDFSQLTPPYATYEEFAKIPSREDLAKKLNIFFKNREIAKRSVEKKLNIEKLIIDLVEQLKEMENTYSETRSPKSEIEEAGKQIKTITDIHKTLLRLKRSNDSSI